MVYVAVVNRNSKHMTGKQKVLRALYPIVSGISRLTGKNSKSITNNSKTKPLLSFYDLSVPLNNGSKLSLKELRGKKIMLVNTASECGYTGQYAELQKLYQQYKEKLVIIGFPANDFKEQEKLNDQEIESFCTINFGVTFPLASKSTVVRSPEQNAIYKWLTDKSQNGWNNKQPSWNFAKYIVDEQGTLTHYFDPAISPQSDEVVKAITN
jgi:glutathione peroxidase